MTITGPLSPSGGPLNKSRENGPSLKLVRRHPPLRLNINRSSEGCVLKTRIFIARKLIALSASLASLAVWIAPEMTNGPARTAYYDAMFALLLVSFISAVAYLVLRAGGWV